jgi:AcrR family transcriptional regulator
MSQERRIKHRENLRKKIIKSAQKIASKEGWEAVTMRRLSADIKYSLPVLYHYFKSKEDIIINVADLGFRQLLVEFDNIPETKNYSKFAYNMAEVYFTFGVNNEALYHAMYGNQGISSFTDGNPTEGEKLFFHIQAKLEELKEKGATIDNSFTATKVLWSMMHGLVSLHLINRIVDEKTTVEDMLNDFSTMICDFWKLDKIK